MEKLYYSIDLCKKGLSIGLLLVILLYLPAFSADLVPLYPKIIRPAHPVDGQGPGGYTPWLDPLYSLSHADSIAEYYLGSGALNDTFFVVFEPQAACSVYYAEMQWYDAGNCLAFAAFYSDAATAMYPGGIAPPRGQSPVSPIGEWITGTIPNTTLASGNWELLNLGGAEWIVGDPVTLESDLFGIGFIKQGTSPRPLADDISAYGINYSYTWFGGPWMQNYTYDWGAYSSNYAATVIELMMRVWVSFPFTGGGFIIINNVYQKSDTYDTIGPFHITCQLEDENGITAADITQLCYISPPGDTTVVSLQPETAGTNMYGADINGPFAVGEEIVYWIHTVKDNGLVNNSIPQNFNIVAPLNPTAPLLLVNDHIAIGNLSAYTGALEFLDVQYECWNVEEHQGIDESVVNFGWENILLAAWGASTIPVEDDYCVYSGFLDNGGNLCYIDQDYFYANNMPPVGVLIPGDFACDYFGIVQYWNDPNEEEYDYYGEAGNPVSANWDWQPYETYWDNTGLHMNLDSYWADYVTAGAADETFYGVTNGYTYGVNYQTTTFKTVYLTFMAEANCAYDSVFGNMEPTADFIALLQNTLTWFGVTVNPGSGIMLSLTPHNPPITIPSGGGSFIFDLQIDNINQNAQLIDVWTNITLPSGVTYPIITRSNISLAAGASIIRSNLTQFVPGSAVGGDYSYNAYVRDHNTWELLAQDSFPFTKLPSDGSSNHSNGWALSGWDEASTFDLSPLTFDLKPPSPTPFNASTTIDFELPAAVDIRLTVYDITGREVQSLVNSHQSIGKHSVVWDAGNHSSGVYFVRLSVDGGQSSVRKVVLMK